MKTALEIALERSQKIWEVTTPEELSNIELQKEVGQIVSKHLKGEMTVAQMIKYVIERENADDMLRNIQRHLLDCIRIKLDITPICESVLALESEKKANNVKKIKYIFDYEIIPLREQYDMVVEDAKRQIAGVVRKRLEMTVGKLKEQLGQQGMSVMVDDMNNVPVENSPEWIKFSTGNDNRFNQMFTQHTEQIKTLL